MGAMPSEPVGDVMQRSATLDAQRRLLMRVLLGCVLATLWARCERTDLASPDELLPPLLQAPRQGPTDRAPFAFDYRGSHYEVRPVHSYELWGLVVTRNDITSIGDLYHDADSVDTVDVCVVWGSNLERGAYEDVRFSSGSYTCYWRYWGNVDFRENEIANNHLITASDAVRDAIGDVRVGDQIHIKGMLVDYRAERWGKHWRRSSTVRHDTGGGACEVLYVESFETLRSENAVANVLYPTGVTTCALLLLGWCVLLFRSATGR